MKLAERIAWIPMCCVCRKVRDDHNTARLLDRQAAAQWMSLRSFLRSYRNLYDDYKLTHTYCPSCLPRLGSSLHSARMTVLPPASHTSGMEPLAGNQTATA